MPTKTLLHGGVVVDGTARAGFFGHVLLEGDRITAVVRQGDELPAAEVIVDVAGKVIAPGFIDMHSHVDFLVPNASHGALLRPLLEQGVTTVVAGNCGISPAPTGGRAMRAVERIASVAIDSPLDFAWQSMQSFFERVAAVGPAVNLAMLVGHGALRCAYGDTRRGALGAAALGACLRGARQALDEGACGLSLGLGYDPGMYSPLQELAAFAAVAAAAGKPLTVHLKAYGAISPCYPLHTLEPHNVRALREVLELARQTGVRLQLSHFIFVGRRSLGTVDACLALVDQARAGGLDVMLDAFPYACGNTTIDAALPHWFLRRVPEAFASASLRARLRLELALGFRLVGFGWDDVQLMNPGVPGWDELCGLRLPAIAARWGVSPFAAMLRLAERSRGSAMMLYHGYSAHGADAGPLERVLARDDCLFETDAVFRSSGHPNPAALGTFPRVLGHCVRERRLFSLEAAVHRMTGAAAARFGLRERGVVAPGCAADLTVFDPATVADSPPVGAEPAGRPVGIEHVFVNGVEVVRGGQLRHEGRVGRVLCV